jgi:transcriptional regulator with XRE-family HTH domain
MGRVSRHTPKYLAKKLAAIRKSLGIETFDEMVSRLSVKEVSLYRSTICEYENGKREPPLIVLLKYAKLVGISTDDLIDDKVKIIRKLSGR